MYFRVLLVSLAAFVYSVNAGVAPFITKCRKEDSKCMKTSAQAAIPIVASGVKELGMKPLDPFYIKTLDGSSANLKLILSEFTGTGMKDCIVKKIEHDDAKSKLFVKLQCTVDFRGQYEMSGQLLVLPIQGKGNAHVVLRKVVISADVDMKETTGADGKQYWKIKSYQHSYELKDKATIELENLFNGNEVLGRAASGLLRDSPNEIVNAVGPKIVEAVVHDIVETIKKFFSKAPLSELVEY